VQAIANAVVGGAAVRGLAIKGLSVGSFGNRFGSTMADAIAQAATRSIIQGNSFGDNLIASLPSAIGNLAGRALAGASGITPLIDGKRGGVANSTMQDSSNSGTGGQQTIGQQVTDEIVVTATRRSSYQPSFTFREPTPTDILNSPFATLGDKMRAQAALDLYNARKQSIMEQLHRQEMAANGQRRTALLSNGKDVAANPNNAQSKSPAASSKAGSIYNLPFDVEVSDMLIWQPALTKRLSDFNASVDKAGGISSFNPKQREAYDIAMEGFADNQAYIDRLDAAASAQLAQDGIDFLKIYAITAATMAGGYGVNALIAGSALKGASAYGATFVGEGLIGSASGSAMRNTFGENVTFETATLDFALGGFLSVGGRFISNRFSNIGVSNVAAAKGAPAFADVVTPYGPALQSSIPEALAARSAVQGGTPLYRLGTIGKSEAAEAQFWALEHPLNPGFAARYGIPPANVAKFNFIETATLKPGTPFVTRPAPGIGSNPGGGIEVVVPSNGVTLKYFGGR
jgi:hypothetical protein